MADLQRTALYDLHVETGGKMVPFAGWEMPVQFALGVMGEHLHTREKAGLFDVSHMGQVILRPAPGGHMDVLCLALEALVPVDVLALKEGRQRYGVFTNAAGGIEDDLMIARRADCLYLVVNAARATHDIALMRAGLEGRAEIEVIADRALLALQGPAAEAALERLVPGVAGMRFMDSAVFGEMWISRSGYSGEDGYEISLPNGAARGFAEALLAMDEVAPIGLGARDSLRLEAGLCLYGNDIDATTTPVEAAIEWAMQKSRRPGGARAGGYPGADVIGAALDGGAARRRVGFLPEGRAPMRAGTEIFATETAEAPIGAVTSGGFGPSIGAPVSMGYAATQFAETGTPLWAEVRGKRLPLTVADMPFRPSTYKR